jgi:hypothetical protein
MTNVNPKARPSGNATFATAPVATLTEADLIQLHAQACNGLAAALHHLRTPSDNPAAMWQQATARAARALTMLKRASAHNNLVKGI